MKSEGIPQEDPKIVLPSSPGVLSAQPELGQHSADKAREADNKLAPSWSQILHRGQERPRDGLILGSLCPSPPASSLGVKAEREGRKTSEEFKRWRAVELLKKIADDTPPQKKKQARQESDSHLPQDSEVRTSILADYEGIEIEHTLRSKSDAPDQPSTGVYELMADGSPINLLKIITVKRSEAWKLHPFVQEYYMGRSLATLTHHVAHCVAAKQVLIGDGDGYQVEILTEYGGTALRTRLGQLQPRDALALALQLLETICELERRGVGQLLLTPDNILLDDSTGFLKLTDLATVAPLYSRADLLYDCALNLAQHPSRYTPPEFASLRDPPSASIPELLPEALLVFGFGAVVSELLQHAYGHRGDDLTDFLAGPLKAAEPAGHLSTLLEQCLLPEPQGRPTLAQVQSQLQQSSLCPASQVPAFIDVPLIDYRILADTYAALEECEAALWFYKKFVRSIKLRSSLADLDYNMELAFVYERMADMYYRLNEYPRTLKYDLLVERIVERVHGKSHPRLGNLYTNIGQTFENMQEHSVAIDYCLKAERLLCRVSGELHPSLIQAYVVLGTAYLELQQYDMAESYLHKAEKLQVRLQGERSPELRGTYNALSVLYIRLNDLERARGVGVQAKKLMKLKSGKQHPDLAAVYNNLGVVHRLRGALDKALKYHQKALNIRKNLYGEKHPSLGILYNNIGLVYRLMKDSKREKESHMALLEIKGVKPEELLRAYLALGDYSSTFASSPAAVKYYYCAGKMGTDELGGGQGKVFFSERELETLEKLRAEDPEAETCARLLEAATEKALIRSTLAQSADCRRKGNLCCAEGNYAKAIEHFCTAIDHGCIETDENLADVFYKLAVAFSNTSQFSDAERSFKKAEAALTKTAGREGDLARVYRGLGSVYRVLGKHQDALKYYNQGLQLLRLVYGEEHTEIAHLYNNIGNVYQDLRDFEQALEYHQSACHLLLNCYSEVHPDVAKVYSNLMVTYCALGRYSEADEYSHKAIEVWQRLYGENANAPLADVYDNQGLMLVALNRHENAIEMFKRAQTMRQDCTHLSPQTAARFHANMAAAYKAINKFDAAIKECEEAEAVYVAAGLEKHPEVSPLCALMAEIYEGLHESAKAIAALHKTVELKLQLHGKNESSFIPLYLKLAHLCESTKDDQGALNNYEKAAELRAQLDGDDHDDLLLLYPKLARSHSALNNRPTAITYWTKAAHTIAKKYGPENPTLLEAYSELGRLYMATHEYDNAIQALCKSEPLRLQISSSEDPAIADLYLQLGQAHKSRNQDSEACSALLKAKVALEKLQDKPRLMQVCQELADIYHKSKNLLEESHILLPLVELRKQQQGEKDGELLILYSRLARIFKDLGDAHTSRNYVEKVAEVARATFGEETAQTADACMLKAEICRCFGDVAVACDSIQQAINIRSKLFTEWHEQVAEAYVAYGQLYQDVSDPNSSLPYFVYARDILLQVCGETSPSLIPVYTYLQQAYTDLNDNANASIYANAINTIHQANPPAPSPPQS